MTKTEFKEFLILRYDPDEIIDMLGLSTEDLLDYLFEVVWDNKVLFTQYNDD